MGWGELFKINSNRKKAFNEILYKQKCNPIRVISQTGEYSPEKTGTYRVICVGAGGDGYINRGQTTRYYSGGGGGGIAIKDIRLSRGSKYNVTVSTTASFSNILTATAGTTANYASSKFTPSVGGTGSGGTYNYSGKAGTHQAVSSDSGMGQGGSVGAMLTDLYRQHMFTDVNANVLYYGGSVLRYGGGAPASNTRFDSVYEDICPKGFPAAILIIPLEMEE